MEQNILENLYNTYRKFDSRTEKLKTALQSSILSFNLGKGVNFSVTEDPKNTQDFSVTFTLSYRDKSYVIGFMHVHNFDAPEKKNITFSNHFIQQMVDQRKSFDDPTIVIDNDSAEEQALHFLQKHRKVSSQMTAFYLSKDVKDAIDEFLKAILRPQGEANTALYNCLAKYPKHSTWPLYALSGSALVFLAMCITGSVFMNIIANMELEVELINLFILADFGGVIGGMGTVACLIGIALLASSALRYNSMRDNVIHPLTQINNEKSGLPNEVKKLLESSVDQEASLVKNEEGQDSFHPSPVPITNRDDKTSTLAFRDDAKEGLTLKSTVV